MGCGKVTYRTKGDAYRALRRMQRTMRRSKLPIRIYYCRSDKGWHTTSKPLIKGSE